jgi:uncharacterized protein (TIGR03118 family)
MRYFRRTMMVLTGLTLVAALSTGARATSYNVQNLVSDVPGLAARTDANLKNPWGLGFGTGTPFWAGDQGAGVSTLYPATGTNGLIVTIPGGGAATMGSPTGVVNNSVNGVATGQFSVNGATASFIFATLDGTIAAWNNIPSGNTLAAREVDNSFSGAVYTGLAIASTSPGQFFLYAANNHSGAIDVFGPNTFASGTTGGNFTDPNLPVGAAPYNIQLIGGTLFVTYKGGGNNLIDEFDTSGNFIKRFATGGPNVPLSSPWGMALAPLSFGQFGGDLLVGNKGNGQINAFDPNTGTFLGTLTDLSGNPIAFPGLWALAFRTGGGFDPNALFFATGVTAQGGDLFAHGIFGEITAIPEPSSAILLGVGLIVLGVGYHARARRRQGLLDRART